MKRLAIVLLLCCAAMGQTVSPWVEHCAGVERCEITDGGAGKPSPQIESSSAKHFNKKVFAVESTILTVSNILDGYTTVKGQQHGLVETFPLMRGYQFGPGSYIGVAGGIQAATMIAAYYLERSHNKYLRAIGHAGMLIEAAGHFWGAANNMQMPEW